MAEASAVNIRGGRTPEGYTNAVESALLKDGAVTLKSAGSAAMSTAAAVADALVSGGIATITGLQTGQGKRLAELQISLSRCGGCEQKLADRKAAREQQLAERKVARLSAATKRDPKFILVGAYTQKLGHVDGKAEGVCVLRRPGAGWGAKAKVVHTCPISVCGENPTYLAYSGTRSCVYVANEYGGPDLGDGARALRLDRKSGELSLINTATTDGFACCHVTLDAAERHAVFANYCPGTAGVVVYSLRDDGGLGTKTAAVAMTPIPERPIGGPGSRPHRQEGSHTHSVCYLRTAAGKDMVYVCDLGLDGVFGFALDAASGALSAAGSMTMAAGDGPRHCHVHPSGRWVYICNELSSTLAVASVGDDGALTLLSSTSTLPAGHAAAGPPADDKKNTTAAVRLASAGCVLVSNRGHDSIAVFSVDKKTGAPTLQRNVKVATKKEAPEDGEGTLSRGPDGNRVSPRDFLPLLNGTVLLASGQNSSFTNSWSQSSQLAARPGPRSFAGAPRRVDSAALSPVCLCPA